MDSPYPPLYLSRGQSLVQLESVDHEVVQRCVGSVCYGRKERDGDVEPRDGLTQLHGVP